MVEIGREHRFRTGRRLTQSFTTHGDSEGAAQDDDATTRPRPSPSSPSSSPRNTPSLEILEIPARIDIRPRPLSRHHSFLPSFLLFDFGLFYTNHMYITTSFKRGKRLLIDLNDIIKLVAPLFSPLFLFSTPLRNPSPFITHTALKSYELVDLMMWKSPTC
ncbi:hypothetical protein B0F90DRAFT_309789 [Multifurca ochricompacta]|uniref:Uncharacterized protein n=1 Tax=Multifurca ochricompacta TaxID=376703 RepID=A0AAD4M513_9AGAM|nr:hypothetical protein B0F90DRAFT_309789 [Multifurca ochricompacta]